MESIRAVLIETLTGLDAFLLQWGLSPGEISQGQLLNQWYDSTGIRFQVPVYQWKSGDPNTWGALQSSFGLPMTRVDYLRSCLPTQAPYTLMAEKQLIDAFVSLRDNRGSRYYGNLPLLDRKSSAFTKISYVNFVGSSTYGKPVPPYVTPTSDTNGGGGVGFVPSWTNGQAVNVPYHPLDNTVSERVVTAQTLYPYVPGLSDSIMSNMEHYPSGLIGAMTAGLDCNALIQQSITYAGSDAVYSATKDPKFRKTPLYWGDTTWPESAMDNFHSPSYAANVVNFSQWSDATPNSPIPTKVYDQFQYLVPGDVIWRSGHIMLVSNVGAPSGPNSRYLASDVSLIESIFRKQPIAVFGVVKQRVLDDESQLGSAWQIWRQK